MKKQFQFTFEGFKKQKDCFGGSLLKNSNAKVKRPLESKLPIHLVLRSKKGVLRLPKTIRLVNQTVEDVAKKHGVTIYKYANVGNHLHMVIKIPARTRWSAFIRELTGKLAQRVQVLRGRQKGIESFWLKRPFTRIVRGWQRAFKSALQYVELNQLEAEGFISRKDTKTLKDLRAIFQDG
ncbi:MAG: transposase [Bdellovibrionales bacterium]